VLSAAPHHAIPRSRHTYPGKQVPLCKKRRIAHKKILKTNPIGSLLATSLPKNKPNQTQSNPIFSRLNSALEGRGTPSAHYPGTGSYGKLAGNTNLAG
jgi:hypothetical protein